jgi:hypothetical protein
VKTTEETIRATVYVYARAKTPYQLENLSEGELPYDYHVKDYDYGDESSVRICAQDILLQIPAGIDVTQKCIENLKEKIRAVEEQAKKDIEDLNKRIRDLSLIEFQPENVDCALPSDEELLWNDDENLF